MYNSDIDSNQNMAAKAAVLFLSTPTDSCFGVAPCFIIASILFCLRYLYAVGMGGTDRGRSIADWRACFMLIYQFDGVELELVELEV